MTLQGVNNPSPPPPHLYERVCHDTREQRHEHHRHHHLVHDAQRQRRSGVLAVQEACMSSRSSSSSRSSRRVGWGWGRGEHACRTVRTVRDACRGWGRGGGSKGAGGDARRCYQLNCGALATLGSALVTSTSKSEVKGVHKIHKITQACVGLLPELTPCTCTHPACDSALPTSSLRAHTAPIRPYRTPTRSC